MDDRDRAQQAAQLFDTLLQENLPRTMQYLDDRQDVLKRYGIHREEYHLPLRPIFLTRAMFQHIQDAVEAFWGGLLDVYRCKLDGDPEKAADFLGTPRPLLPWLLDTFKAETSVDQLFGRPDAYLVGSTIRFIEQNITSGPGGIASTDLMAQLFDELPAIEDLRQHMKVSKISLTDAYADFFSTDLSDQHVAFIDALDPDTGKLFCNQGILMMEQLRDRGVHLHYVPHSDPRFDEAGMYIGEDRMDALYRCAAALGVVDCIDAFRPFLDVCREAGTRMVMSPYEIIFFDKLLLPFLSDHELNGFLADERRELLDRVLPWTRFLRDEDTFFEGRRVNIPELCRTHQDRLVIKQGNGWGSRAVVLGPEVTAQEWATRVGDAIRDGDWILQEMVTPDEERLPFIHAGELTWADVVTMTCPFIVKGRVSGIGSRTSMPGGTRVLVGAGMQGSQAGIRAACIVE